MGIIYKFVIRMSAQPAAVLWALTKRHNAFKVRFNGSDWSHNPNSMTGFHNATDAASTMGLNASKAKTGKARRTYTLTLSKRQKSGLKKLSVVRSLVHDTRAMNKGL